MPYRKSADLPDPPTIKSIRIIDVRRTVQVPFCLSTKMRGHKCPPYAENLLLGGYRLIIKIIIGW